MDPNCVRVTCLVSIQSPELKVFFTEEFDEDFFYQNTHVVNFEGCFSERNISGVYMIQFGKFQKVHFEDVYRISYEVSFDLTIKEYDCFFPNSYMIKFYSDDSFGKFEGNIDKTLEILKSISKDIIFVDLIGYHIDLTPLKVSYNCYYGDEKEHIF